MGNSILLWLILIVHNMIKKEITDKVNQLRYNLGENKSQMVASVHSFTSFTRSLQQPLIFFV